MGIKDSFIAITLNPFILLRHQLGNYLSYQTLLAPPLLFALEVCHLLNDEWLNQLQLAVIKYQLIYLSVRDSKQGTRGFPASYNTETSKCHHIFNKVKDYVRN